VSEVERKFLLGELPSGLEARDRIEIEQGYLALDEGAEVRVRLAGSEGTIAAKSGSGLEREEVEVEIDATRARELLDACGADRLRKRRHLVPLGDGLCAEVDVYRGELGGLAVVEVEFPDAERAAAFAPPRWFGRELTGDAAFANRSLATRGMPEAVPAPGRNRDYRLTRGEQVGDGLRRIVLGRAAHALEELRGIESGEADATEAVHAVRKDMKKARSAVRLLRHALSRRDRDDADGRLRDAGRALAASRDAEVKLQTLADLVERFDGLPSEAIEAWRRILERDAEAAGNTLADEAAVAEARGLIEAAWSEAERWRLAETDWPALEAALARIYRRGREAMRRAERRGEERALHEWRKRAKDLWYALRILGGSWPRLLDATAEEAHELADLLGDHHDLAVLRDDLGSRALGELETASLQGAILEREQELAVAALDLGRRLYAEPPKAFRRRLRAYWTAWRG
jgi:CYTH domain-containing protein/CHAD domain-containing protein